MSYFSNQREALNIDPSNNGFPFFRISLRHDGGPEIIAADGNMLLLPAKRIQYMIELAARDVANMQRQGLIANVQYLPALDHQGMSTDDCSHTFGIDFTNVTSGVILQKTLDFFCEKTGDELLRSSLSSLRISERFNEQGFNLHVPRLQNENGGWTESHRDWARRTKHVANVLAQATQGEIKPVHATFNNGRIVADVAQDAKVRPTIQSALVPTGI